MADSAKTVEALLSDIRNRISDSDKLTYSEDELISYINTIIDFLNHFLINQNSQEMIKEITVSNGSAVPDDWVRSVGSYPIYITQDIFSTYDESAELTVRYFALKPHVSAITDTLPFKPKYESILAQGAALHAANTDGYDISQDKGLLKDLLDVIAVR